MRYEQLNNSQKRAYKRALADEVIESRIEVIARNQDEDPTGSLTADADWERSIYRGIPGVLDGQVDLSLADDVESQLDLTVSDPEGKLDFDRNSPGRSALWPDRFVSVEHHLYVDSLDDWVERGVFWGPVSRWTRDGTTVSIEALGKESLALAPCVLWKTMRLQKGMRVTEAIKRLLRQQGERRFNLPDIDRKLHRNVNVGKREQPWKVAKRLAASIDCQLFYDGDGRATLRKWPRNPRITFTENDSGTQALLSQPSISYDFDRVRNVVEVLGAKPEKGIKRIRAVAYAPREHPLSAQKLARNGEPRYIVETIETGLEPRTKSKTVTETEWKNGKKKEIEEENVWAVHDSVVKRKEQAQEKADRILESRLRAALDVSFDCLPQWHLQLGDVLGLHTDYTGKVEFRLRATSLPLTASGGQSINVNKSILRLERHGKKKSRR